MRRPAKVGSRSTESELAAADIEGAFFVRGPLRAPAWIAFRLAITIGHAVLGSARFETKTADVVFVTTANCARLSGRTIGLALEEEF